MSASLAAISPIAAMTMHALYTRGASDYLAPFASSFRPDSSPIPSNLRSMGQAVDDTQTNTVAPPSQEKARAEISIDLVGDAAGHSHDRDEPGN